MSSLHDSLHDHLHQLGVAVDLPADLPPAEALSRIDAALALRLSRLRTPPSLAESHPTTTPERLLTDLLAQQHRDLLQTVITYAPVGIAILLGPDHRYALTNPAYHPFIQEKDEIIGHTVAEVFPEIAGTIIPLLDHVYQRGEPFSTVESPLTFMRHGQPVRSYITFSYTPIHAAEGKIIGILVLAIDSTEQVRARQLIEQEHARLQTILTTLPVGVLIIDDDGHILQTNAALERIFGEATPFPVGQVFTHTFHGWRCDNDQPIAQEDWPSVRAVTAGEVALNEEIRIQRADGAGGVILNSAVPLRDNTGRITGAVVVIQDITEQKLAEVQLNQLAFYDPLTGLPNRRMLIDRLSHTLARLKRQSGTFALLFLDLDHFKEVNDTMGHPAGDALLQEVAARLQRCIREGDTVARMGGDEFVILLDNLEREARADLEIAAERIQDAIAQPCQILGHTLPVSASIGIALAPCDGMATDVLMKRADIALYRAKAQGRHTYRFFNDDPQPCVDGQLTLEDTVGSL